MPNIAVEVVAENQLPTTKELSRINFRILAERREPSGVTKTGGLAPFRYHQTAELDSGQFLGGKRGPRPMFLQLDEAAQLYVDH